MNMQKLFTTMLFAFSGAMPSLRRPYYREPILSKQPDKTSQPPYLLNTNHYYQNECNMAIPVRFNGFIDDNAIEKYNQACKEDKNKERFHDFENDRNAHHKKRKRHKKHNTHTQLGGI